MKNSPENAKIKALRAHHVTMRGYGYERESYTAVAPVGVVSMRNYYTRDLACNFVNFCNPAFLGCLLLQG